MCLYLCMPGNGCLFHVANYCDVPNCFFVVPVVTMILLYSYRGKLSRKRNSFLKSRFVFLISNFYLAFSNLGFLISFFCYKKRDYNLALQQPLIFYSLVFSSFLGKKYSVILNFYLAFGWRIT